MNKYYMSDDFFKSIYKLNDELKKMEKENDER